MQLALEMSEAVRRIARDGVRHRHPEYTEEAVDDELEDMLLGRELAVRARAWRRGGADAR